MIEGRLKFFLLLAVALYFFVLFQLLKRKLLDLKYALLWIFSGMLMSIAILCPGLLVEAACLLGIQVPANMLFAFAFLCVLMILMSLTAIVSALNKKIQTLAETLALMDKSLRDYNTSDGSKKIFLREEKKNE